MGGRGCVVIAFEESGETTHFGGGRRGSSKHKPGDGGGGKIEVQRKGGEGGIDRG